jgi:Outer membrane protein beta-barrel domain
MKNRMPVIAALLFAATPAFAQGPVPVTRRTPVAELFGGFSYARLNDSGTTTNTKGIVGSFAWNAKPWLQIVADSSYNVSSYNNVNVTLYGNHFGVRVFDRERNKWRASPFAEVLVGGSHVDNTVTGAGGLQYTDTAFSMKAGGGVDFNLTPHFAVRVFDADYYRTTLFGGHQNNIWLTTGFVIRLGGARPQ